MSAVVPFGEARGTSTNMEAHQPIMSVWLKLGQFLSAVSTASAGRLTGIVEAVRTAFEGDPETRRRVAFSIAMIALSAKMAKADGIVTPDEVMAFEKIFAVPTSERGNVGRLYNLATRDIAGYEAYAERMARLCGSGEANCPMLEDILDGLFHIAKADGVIHEREVAFLGRIAEIFMIDGRHFETILARHADLGSADPYRILGIERGATREEARRRYLELVTEYHPDRLIGRGVPEEFIAIANDRLAAINGAWAKIEREFQSA
jgi:DnaJ like chaperone protein